MPFNPQPIKNFIGSGLIFPIQLTNGKANIDTGFALIRAAINNILSFTIGRRYYLGEFGSRLQELLEEPNDEVLKNLVNTFVIDAITTWEKRISTVSAEVVSFSPESIDISITYQIKNSQTVDNFIYPFYLQLIY